MAKRKLHQTHYAVVDPETGAVRATIWSETHVEVDGKIDAIKDHLPKMAGVNFIECDEAIGTDHAFDKDQNKFVLKPKEEKSK